MDSEFSSDLILFEIMRFRRFVILLPFFLIADPVLWIVGSVASHIGFHQSSETLLKHRQLLNWLLGRSGGDAQKWDPEGYRR